jgi:hypothetical protein
MNLTFKPPDVAARTRAQRFAIKHEQQQPMLETWQGENSEHIQGHDTHEGHGKESGRMESFRIA